jgi:hypothetical protein
VRRGRRRPLPRQYCRAILNETRGVASIYIFSDSGRFQCAAEAPLRPRRFCFSLPRLPAFLSVSVRRERSRSCYSRRSPYGRVVQCVPLRLLLVVREPVRRRTFRPVNRARSRFRASRPILACVVMILAGCRGHATTPVSDTRTRVNEEHVTIYQDASMNSPIVGMAIENGTPAKGDFRADVRVLELSVLGDVDHASACGVVLERERQTKPSRHPFDDLSFSENSTIDRYAAIACSERANSTKLTLADGSIDMTGHVEYETYGDENEWVYHIDHISRAPRITTFVPPDSFVWPPPTSTPGQP